MIPEDQLERGGVYQVRARNFTIAAYDGSGGFIGIREKLGSVYLFTEYLRAERFGPVGTVLPLEKIGHVPDDVSLRERDDALRATLEHAGGAPVLPDRSAEKAELRRLSALRSGEAPQSEGR